MNQTNICSRAAEAVAEALETMAFLSAVPAEGEVDCPPDAVLVVIEFSGSVNGSLEMMAPAALGALLAANVHGIAADEPAARDCAADALKEIANVACGILLRGLPENVELALPKLRPTGAEAWTEFAHRNGAETLDVEGFPLCLRLNGKPA